MIDYSNKNFNDLKIKFEKGVAQIDLITLKKVAQVVDEKLGGFNLPLISDIEVSKVFDKFTNIKIDSLKPLIVSATIDTKKMSWDYEEGKILKAQFTDYTGKNCYGVSTTFGFLANILSLNITKYKMKLNNGQKLNMFVSDAPNINKIKLYSLWSLAQKLTDKYNMIKTRKESFTKIIIPALQIKYSRVMTEIEKINYERLKINAGGKIVQKAFVALDETGVRVKAVTEMKEGFFNKNPETKVKVFGEKKPVMYWFTQENGNVPFAVFLTNSDAWLSPNSTVSFDNKNFIL